MKTIAFFNNKGGVGKSTTVINVAYAMTKLGKKIIVTDCDGQMNTSRFFADELPPNGVERVFLEENPTPVCAFTHTRYENLDIVCSTTEMNIATSKFEQFPEDKRRKRAEKLNDWEKPYTSVQYDYSIIDLPPALNSLTTSILGICDYVFVPIELGTFAIQGIANVTDSIAATGAKFGGCFVSKFDRNNPADHELNELLHATLGNKAMSTRIPYSRVIKNSISYRLTAFEYMEWTEAVSMYMTLTQEIIMKCEENGYIEGEAE